MIAEDAQAAARFYFDNHCGAKAVENALQFTEMWSVNRN